MKNYLILSILLSFTGFLFGQNIKIIDPDNPTVGVNGNTLEVVDASLVNDLDVDLFVVNTSASVITLTCTRIEVDALAGTQNSTCWQICPETLNVGVRPTYVVNISGTALEETAAAGDTIKSFSGHYSPQGQEGCSLFRYEWKDANSGNLEGFVYVRFIHQTSGVCTASQPEMNFDFEMYPNPVNEEVNIQLNEVFGRDVKVRIVDMLGQTVSTFLLEKGSLNKSLSTSELNNGVYFVNFSSNGEDLLTKKIVVRH